MKDMTQMNFIEVISDFRTTNNLVKNNLVLS